MSWLKAGDNADTHPIVLAVLGATGDWLLMNAVFGFVMRCAIHAAGHTTDYFISDGVAHAEGGPVTKLLCATARRAGYWERATVGGRKGWKLVDDPEFIHIRLRSEIDWERQQKADVRNVALIVPVRLRDGDACRYCRAVVNWRDKRGPRRGTYDHRRPGEAARGPDDLVVACGSCNFGRRDHDDADEQYPLLPPPQPPYYSAYTAAFLRGHGHQVTASDDRPDGQSGGDPRDPAPSGTPRAQRNERDPAAGGSTRAEPPGDQEAAAPSLAPVLPLAPRDPAPSRSTRPDLPDPADPLPTGSGSVGSGRDRDGPGSGHGSGSGGRPPPPATRRSRRRSARGRPRAGGSR
ncbi:MAG: hypothetical protein ACJ74O_13615 [Frankiaceae bacterium]|jgi:hypothetical protein